MKTFTRASGAAIVFLSAALLVLAASVAFGQDRPPVITATLSSDYVTIGNS